MREILFRAKATNRIDGREYRTNYKNGDWVYGLLANNNPYLDFAEMTNTDGVSGIDVDKNTVGQYIGLHDGTMWENLSEKEKDDFLRNHKQEEWKGKPIFEGDIFKYSWNGKLLLYKVVYDCDIASFIGITLDNKKYIGFHMIYNIYNIAELFVVIGNIHDNPELIGGANNG